MRAVLFSAISASKAKAGNAFSHAPGLCSGQLWEGETLPKLGQAAQKQMRSDTGAKEYLPEPLQAHITKCSTLRLLCSVSTLHVEITDMEKGGLWKWGEWVSVFLVFVFAGKGSE